MGATSSVEVANAFPSDVWVRVDSERVLVSSLKEHSVDGLCSGEGLKKEL